MSDQSRDSYMTQHVEATPWPFDKILAVLYLIAIAVAVSVMYAFVKIWLFAWGVVNRDGEVSES